MIEKDILTDLYVNKRLATREVGDILGCDKKTVSRWLKYHSIEMTREKRKFETLKKHGLTREQKEILFGTMLGDGHIATHGNQARLMISHCGEQKALTELIHGLMAPTSLQIREYLDPRTQYKYFGFNTITHIDFTVFRKMFYEDSRKIVPDSIATWLSPQALAIWIMDDGTLNKDVNIRIQTDNFTYQENVKLVEVLKLLYGINVKVCEYTRRNKKYYFLSMNKRNSIIISDIVRPYIIPEMLYKLVKPLLNDYMPNTPSG